MAHAIITPCASASAPSSRALLNRIAARKRAHKVHNTRLVVNQHGRAIGTNAMSRRWVKACEAAGIEGVQFRDLRAKAGTDKTESARDIRQAQQQLGHASVVMTEAYARAARREGDADAVNCGAAPIFAERSRRG